MNNHTLFPEGPLYYTMPLADNARSTNSVPDWDAYESLSLQWKIDKCGRLPVDTCVEIGRQIIKGVHALHEKGMVHRDIKPSNILFLDRLAVLGDLGLITNESCANSQVGTPGYMSPEGVGEQISEIYAIGQVLCQMATGHQTSNGLTSLPGSDPRLGRLMHVIALATESDPQKRYINTVALESALKYVLDPLPEPPDKQPETLLTSLRGKDTKPIRNHRNQDFITFKAYLSCLINQLAKQRKIEAYPVRDYITFDDLNGIGEDVLNEFERRLGFRPPGICHACDFSESILEPDRVKRHEISRLLIGVAASCIGFSLFVLALWGTFGSPPFAVPLLKGFGIESQAGNNLVSVVFGAMLAALGLRAIFIKPNLMVQSEEVINDLIVNVVGVTDDLWAEHHAQLSIRNY